MHPDDHVAGAADVADPGPGDDGHGAGGGGGCPLTAFEQLCLNCGLHQDKTVAGHYVLVANDSDRTVGLIHFIGGGVSIKATCKVHPKCHCWVSKCSERQEMVRDTLVQWIGKARSHTEQEHFVESNNVKRGFGMKIKGP